MIRLDSISKQNGHQIVFIEASAVLNRGEKIGLVGPNGAGKTTTLSMATGLLRPDAGTALVHGVDLWAHPVEAKRIIGVLPDGVRLFDRLTGAQLVTYAGLLQGLDRPTVTSRTADLLAAARSAWAATARRGRRRSGAR